MNNTFVTPKLLVSACLLGQPVRYDGKSKAIKELAWLEELRTAGQLVVICPEVAGGLETPRAPAEQRGELVITNQGDNVTEAFNEGAQQALSLCKKNNIQYALLKARSPSCGNIEIYDGTFSNNLVPGMGVTARLLEDNGIKVFSELQIAELKALME